MTLGLSQRLRRGSCASTGPCSSAGTLPNLQAVPYSLRRMITRSSWCGIMITLETFLTLLSAGFIQRAFIIGTIIAVLSSILSVFIVLKRVSLIGDGLAHTAFGGLALGYYLDIYPLWVGAVVVVIGSLGITRAIRSTKISSDAAVAVFLQMGLASGIVLLSLARGFGVNLEGLLFGSILLV